MRDLVERVAEKAGWRKEGHTWVVRYDGRSEIAAFPSVLEPVGTILLLRELLQDGWDLECIEGKYRIGAFLDGFALYGDTLEEAVMLAFLHKGER